MVEISADIVVVEAHQAGPALQHEMLQLQIACFAGQVTAQEIEEDFCRPCVAWVLARHEKELIAVAEVFQRRIEYMGQEILLGGLSPCTRAAWRGRGIGTRICRAAMAYLSDRGCDLAFLSVDTRRAAHPLYERLGFQMLPRPFVYANARGEVRESDGGMIAPLRSPAVFDQVLHGPAPLDLRPEPGYW